MTRFSPTSGGGRSLSVVAAVPMILLTGAAVGLTGTWLKAEEPPKVGPVPAEVRQQFSLSPFYAKHVGVHGFPIVGSAKVSDYALIEADYIISHMLAGREDILRGLVERKVRCTVMAADEFTTDVPEHSDLRPATYWDRRARGLGPTIPRPCISCAEENLLQYPGDPYAAENILVHEFGHAIHEGLKQIDPAFDPALRKVFASAMEKGLWKGKYAAQNRDEYWAEGVQSWFGTNRENDHDHNHVNTRPELEEYDPDLAALLRRTFGENDWQYVFPKDRPEPGHLAGFDRAKAPTFRWPERLKNALAKGPPPEESEPAEFVDQKIEGWTVRVDTRLLESGEHAVGSGALRVLGFKLYEITKLIPQDRLEKLQQVTIVLELNNAKLGSLQYHPSRRWLVDHGHDPALARCVHIPRAAELISRLPVNQQPMVILHELAHAYHDQVLGFDEPRIRQAWEQFRKKERYQKPVAHISGKPREHYALTDQKEFFAEMTEAFFGTNDFFPFVRGELQEAEPEIYALLQEIWGTTPR